MYIVSKSILIVKAKRRMLLYDDSHELEKSQSGVMCFILWQGFTEFPFVEGCEFINFFFWK